MTAFQHDAGVVDADISEVLGPVLELGAVGHGERQMVEAVVDRSGGPAGVARVPW